MNKMKEVAELLGVELNEPFEIEGEFCNPFVIKEDGLYDKYNDKDDETFSCLIWGEYKIKKKWKPEIWKKYYVPALTEDDFYWVNIYIDDDYDRFLLKRGLICKTKEEAIALAKKMLEVAKSK